MAGEEKGSPLKKLVTLALLAVIAWRGYVLYGQNEERKIAEVNNRAAALVDAGDAEEALALLDALKSRPEAWSSAEVQRNRGAAFYKLQRKDEAIAAFEQSLRKNPDQPDVREVIEEIRREAR